MYFYFVAILGLCSAFISEANSSVCQRVPRSGATSENAIDMCSNSKVTGTTIYIDTSGKSIISSTCSCSISINSSSVVLRSLIVPDNITSSTSELLCPTSVTFDMGITRSVGCGLYRKKFNTSSVTEGSVKLETFGMPNQGSGYCLKLNARRAGGLISLTCGDGSSINPANVDTTWNLNETNEIPPFNVMEELLANDNHTKEEIIEEIQGNDTAPVLFEPLFPSTDFSESDLNMNQSLTENPIANFSNENPLTPDLVINVSQPIDLSIGTESTREEINSLMPSIPVYLSSTIQDNILAENRKTVDDWSMFLNTELLTQSSKNPSSKSVQSQSNGFEFPLQSTTTPVLNEATAGAENILESVVPSSIGIVPTKSNFLFEITPTATVDTALISTPEAAYIKNISLDELPLTGNNTVVSAEIVTSNNNSENVFISGENVTYEITTTSETADIGLPSNTTVESVNETSLSGLPSIDTGNDVLQTNSSNSNNIIQDPESTVTTPAKTTWSTDIGNDTKTVEENIESVQVNESQIPNSDNAEATVMTSTSNTPILMNDTGHFLRFTEEENVATTTTETPTETTSRDRTVSSLKRRETTTSTVPILVNDTGHMFKFRNDEITESTPNKDVNVTTFDTAVETTEAPILINDTGNVFKFKDEETTAPSQIQRENVTTADTVDTTTEAPILINDTGNVFKFKDDEITTPSIKSENDVTTADTVETTTGEPILVNDTGNVFKFKDGEITSQPETKSENVTTADTVVETTSHYPILINDTGNVFKIEDMEIISTAKTSSDRPSISNTQSGESTDGRITNKHVNPTTPTTTFDSKDQTVLPGTSASVDHPMEILPLVPNSKQNENTQGIMSNIDKTALDNLFRGTADIMLSTTKEPTGPGVRGSLDRQDGEEEDHLSDETVTIIVIGSVVGILVLIACIVIITTCLTKKKKSNSGPIDNDVEMNGKGIDNPLMNLGNETNPPQNSNGVVKVEPEVVATAQTNGGSHIAENQSEVAEKSEDANAKL